VITTVTVDTVTKIIGLGNILELIMVCALIAFLCIQELASTSTHSGSSPRFLVRSLDVIIVPLLIAFAMIVAIRVVGILHLI